MVDRSVNQAVIIEQESLDQNKAVEQFALFNADGTPFDFNPDPPTASQISMAGYTEAGANAQVSTSDTVRSAIGKLQKQINDLAAVVDAL